MGRITDDRLALSLVGLLASVGLFLLVVGYAALVFVAAILGGAPILATLLDLAVPYLLFAGLLFVTGVVSGVALAWEGVRRASLPNSERLADLAGFLEQVYPPLASLRLSDQLAPPEPTPEERAERELAALKRRYVDGELTEEEFERELERLADEYQVDVGALDADADAEGTTNDARSAAGRDDDRLREPDFER